MLLNVHVLTDRKKRSRQYSFLQIVLNFGFDCIVVDVRLLYAFSFGFRNKYDIIEQCHRVVSYSRESIESKN